mmetsp:Transcript_3828/g.11402  ORF Transcript_3828/g.11402 Transcript_3828/m.11402 type:complete len:295 (+) Transcript_3828:277-1161(+)
MRMGYEIDYPCGENGEFNKTCNCASLLQQGFDAVFINGGGNWGTVWNSKHVEYRPLFIRDCVQKGMKVFQFPVSVFYEKGGDDPQLHREKKILNEESRLKNFVMMSRSHNSFETMTKHFPSLNNILIPDAAFGLGPLAPHGDPKVDVLCFFRVDKESVAGQEKNEQIARSKLTAAGLTHEIMDWKDFGKYMKYYRAKQAHYLPLHRVHMGNAMISRGRVVVCDRLHVAVLAALIRRPHVYFEPSYGKIVKCRRVAFENFVECSPHSLHGARVENVESAIDTAIRWIQSPMFGGD